MNRAVSVLEKIVGDYCSESSYFILWVSVDSWPFCVGLPLAITPRSSSRPFHAARTRFEGLGHHQLHPLKWLADSGLGC